MSTPSAGPVGSRSVVNVFRPKWGIWTLYAFCLVLACLVVATSLLERSSPLWLRVMAVAPSLVILLSLVDLWRSRVELDEAGVRVVGLFANVSLLYAEIGAAPLVVRSFPPRPRLRVKLPNGRLFGFPVWLDAADRRAIAARIAGSCRRAPHPPAATR